MGNKQIIRAIAREARLEGVPRQVAFDIATKITLDKNKNFHINTGTKIKLDVDKIIGEKTYPNKLKEYREFIEESRDKIYTAVFDEDTHMLTLEEEPTWFFLGSDVIVVDNGDAANPA